VRNRVVARCPVEVYVRERRSWHSLCFFSRSLVRLSLLTVLPSSLASRVENPWWSPREGDSARGLTGTSGAACEGGELWIARTSETLATHRWREGKLLVSFNSGKPAAQRCGVICVVLTR
jgi:hypothetical protein